ncbi:hypothetical protein [Aquimarina aggregata]|uniref:hypothetical protein n=1 Tax=Aquimarina aggregata TaxID=1642818 RepID=UPI000A6BF85F|nr:hypothetical protein [Aquimarina aggregata]
MILDIDLKGSLKLPFIGYIIRFAILSFLSFISWNYFGILFVLFWFEVFKLLDDTDNISFRRSFFRFFLIVASWHFGALSWMFGIDQGFFGFLNNLLLHLVPFVVFLVLKNRSTFFRPIFFIPIWLLFEYFENVSLISFPWVILGNVFSNQIYFVQWYEFIGVEGGSLWLLVVSYLLFYLNKHFSYKNLLLFLLVLGLPILLSLLVRGSNSLEHKGGVKKYILYNPEYSPHELLRNKQELAFYLKKKLAKIDTVHAVLIPETTFRGIKLDVLNKGLTFKYLNNSLIENEIEHIFYGATGFDKGSRSLVNGGVFLSSSDDPYLKVKKKLVPYSEYLPKKIAAFLEKIIYNPFVEGSEDEIINNKKVLPLICYEGFFSFFVANKARKTNIIYLISSESFFKESYFGKRQYNNILRLRAIETRLPLLKASFKGESLHLNKFGEVIGKDRVEFASFFVKQSVAKGTCYTKYVDKCRSFLVIIFLLVIVSPFLYVLFKRKVSKYIN